LEKNNRLYQNREKEDKWEGNDVMLEEKGLALPTTSWNCP